MKLALRSRPVNGSVTSDHIFADPEAALAALDAPRANVFVASPDLRLVWMNRMASETAGGLDASLRQAFSVGSNELLGGSIHRFHRDPARVERILRAPESMPHQATFRFGDTTLRTSINRIDGPGGLVGFIVVWDDVTETTATAEGVVTDLHAAAARLGELAGQLTGRVAESLGRAEAVAAGAEQMTASIQEISNSTTRAGSVALEAVETAGTAEEAMRRLDHSSTQVSDVIEVITSIASQTNLLALNATIEAARAGEAGKGFAVVANEVKELARQSATATEQVREVIESMRTDVTAALQAITDIVAVTHSIREQQTTIAAAVEEQSAVTAEIAGNITGVAETTRSSSVAADEVTGLTEDLATRADDLRALFASVVGGP